MDGEVPCSGVLLDLSPEGALEPCVAGWFVVGVVRGRDGPEVEGMSASVPGVRFNCQSRGTAAWCVGSMLAASARVCGGICDGGVMSWRATDLAEDDARQAADLNVTFNQYGQHDQADRREVSPPIEVESAT